MWATASRFERALLVMAALGMALVAGPVLVHATGIDLMGTTTGPDRPQTLGTAGNDTLVGIQSGAIEQYGPAGELAWRHPTEVSMDVTWVNDTHILSTFARDHASRCGSFEPPCGRTGVVLLGRSGTDTTPVFEWSFAVRGRMDSEVHDAEWLPARGEILVLDMEYERLLAVETSTGDVTWTWNASAVYDPPVDPTRTDWLHMNDVDRIDPGRYLVSVRNRNQLLVVERGAGVTQVINDDGDPALLDRQHNPHYLGPGSILVADSNNNRVVELRRTADGDWTTGWALYGAGNRSFAWPRDADRLPNGHTLITDTRNDRVVEVTRAGTVVFQTPTGRAPYEAERIPVGETDAAGVEDYGRSLPTRWASPGRPHSPPGVAMDVYTWLFVQFHMAPWVSPWGLTTVLAGLVLALLAGTGALGLVLLRAHRG